MVEILENQIYLVSLRVKIQVTNFLSRSELFFGHLEFGEKISFRSISLFDLRVRFTRLNSDMVFLIREIVDETIFWTELYKYRLLRHSEIFWKKSLEKLSLNFWKTPRKRQRIWAFSETSCIYPQFLTNMRTR